MRIFLYVIPGISVVLATVDFIFGYTNIAFTTLTVPVFCMAALYFLNRGQINLSMIIITSIMIVATSIICIQGARIHEVGTIIFPVIIFFTSLVMNARAVIITISAVVLCLALIVFGEFYQVFPLKFHERNWIDLPVVLTVLIIHSFMTYSFSNITRNNLTRVRDELETQKVYKAQIAENLVEKTELLRLVHHRVKNNLLLINSLIELEAYDKPEVKHELQEITESIHTIARAHDPLYHTDDYKQVAIKPYLEKLIASFIQSKTIKEINIEIEDRLVFHEKALLLGIIAQKILTSIKSIDFFKLSIELKSNDENLELEILNQNKEEFVLGDTSLIHLLTRQINGKLNVGAKKIYLTFKVTD